VLDVARAAIPWLAAQGIAVDDVLSGAAAARVDALIARDDSKVPVGQRPAAPGALKWWQVRK
jgi:hypothetical protein